MLRRRPLSCALAIMALLAAGCGGTGSPPSRQLATVQVRSTAWPDGGLIKPPYACRHDGDHGESPGVSWQQGPPGTQHYAVTITDLDANGFLHWAAINLPPDTRSLTAGERPPGKQLRNSFGYVGYGAPCPPPGEPHHYRLTVWALRSPVDTTSGLRNAALARGSITARFGR